MQICVPGQRTAISLVCAVVSMAAHAQTRHYEIESGEMKAALDAYMVQSGVQLVYRADDIKQLRSKGLKGQFSADAALNRLIEGTDLQVNRDAGNQAVFVFRSKERQPEASAQLEQVVITGSIVAAQEASILAKRAADNLVDIASADAVGRFPDQNSAAALARLPGIAVQRDQGQERYIQVRGAPNRWTSVSVDGVPVIGVDEGGSSRAYRFDAMPAVLLSTIAVNKSLTPDLPAEAIVANVDMRTYSPLDEKTRGFKLQGDVGSGEMALGGGEQRQLSLRASWKNDRLGLVAGGSHYRRHQVTDNREFDYDELGPTKLDVRNYRLTRENNGAFASAEYQASENTRLFAKSIFTEFNDDEQRNQYVFNLAKAASGTRTFSSGDLVGVPVSGYFNLGEYRTRNTMHSIGADTQGSDWTAALRLNYTGTENTTYLPLVLMNQSSSQRPSIHYDTSNPALPLISLYSTTGGARGSALSTLDQSAFASSMVLPMYNSVTSDSYTLKLDLSKEWQSLVLSGGLSYADRKIVGNTLSTSNVVALTGNVPSFSPGNYVTDTPWSTHFPLGFTLKNMDNVGMRRDIDAALKTLQASGVYDPSLSIADETRYDLKENLLATYLMGKKEFQGGQVIAGVRAENYKLRNVGTATLDDGSLSPMTSRQNYTDLFPSINTRLDLSRDLVLRLAGQRSISRPSFGEIRVGSSINDSTSPGSISGGNPDLKPEITWGLDASVERYLPGKGLLSVAIFNRWVDDVLYSSTRTVGSSIYNSDGVDRSGYQLTSSFNGGRGRLSGIEFGYQQKLSFLPAPFDRLGVQGNQTFLDGNFDTSERKGIPFPGTSKRITNASIYYEHDGLSMRVSYQHRSDWLDTLGGLGTGSGDGDEYRRAYGNLDVSMRYQFSPSATLFADLANLTDAKYIAYSGARERPTEVEQIGRRYLVGVRISY